jgi:hypothetical protein
MPKGPGSYMEKQCNLNLRSEREEIEDLRARIIEARNAGIDVNSFINSLNSEEKLLLEKIETEDREGDQPNFKGH